MSRLIDISGQRFGRWIVVKRLPNKAAVTNARWLCHCDCGNSGEVMSVVLRRGESISCGCYRAEMSASRMTKHGHATKRTTPTYNSWAGAVQRCTDQNCHNWFNYGGRGIRICERWLTYENFFADMGVKPNGRSLDRINNDGNYEPGNCRWATPKEQASNRRVRKDSHSIRIRES